MKKTNRSQRATVGVDALSIVLCPSRPYGIISNYDYVAEYIACHPNSLTQAEAEATRSSYPTNKSPWTLDDVGNWVPVPATEMLTTLEASESGHSVPYSAGPPTELQTLVNSNPKPKVNVLYSLFYILESTYGPFTKEENSEEEVNEEEEEEEEEVSGEETPSREESDDIPDHTDPESDEFYE